MTGYLFSPVRKNVNDYLFITILNADDIGNPENVYFAKALAERGEMPKFGDHLDKEKWFIVETVNRSTGEIRKKVTNKEADRETAVKTLMANKGYTLV